MCRVKSRHRAVFLLALAIALSPIVYLAMPPRPYPVPDTEIRTNRLLLACSLVGCLIVWRCWRRFASRVHRRAEGRCPQCGYDRRASPERCPECGTLATKSP
jgi:hypothetical protein